jgi:hypothetical protein
MEYNRIIAITGLGGLFELLSSKSDGAIVRSLEDNQTKFVSSRLHNFSHLESIEVYTVRENINLVELFQAIQTSGEPLPPEKDAAAIKAFFAKVYPDMDFDRIYNSDMKKMAKWYSLLTASDVEFKLPAPGEEEGETDESGNEPGDDAAVATAPPATKAKAKTAEAPSETASEATAGETSEAPAAEKPKKKAAKPIAGAGEETESPAAKKKAVTPKKKKTDE